MRTKIYCQTTSKGVQSFYLLHEGREHFLFSQDFRQSVKSYYEGGVTVSEALNNSRGGENHALRKTMEKFPSYIRYIEREYGITVLEQTAKKASRKERDRKENRYGKEAWFDEYTYA